MYDVGATNGLVIHGTADCNVRISTDQGQSWHDAGKLTGRLDLTDQVKGCQQYFLQFGAAAKELAQAGLTWRTICQTNAATIPRLHDGKNIITYLASGQGVVAAGPLVSQADAHVIAGKRDTDTVTLELVAPRGTKPLRVYGASWQQSGNPPAPVEYRIDYSRDGGHSWQPMVKDWTIERGTPEPTEYWSQSFTWGNAGLDQTPGGTPIRVRFSNSGGKLYRKVDAYLTYEVADSTAAEVTFAWTTDGQLNTATHSYSPRPASSDRDEDATWVFDAGRNVETRWVEIESQ